MTSAEGPFEADEMMDGFQLPLSGSACHTATSGYPSFAVLWLSRETAQSSRTRLIELFHTGIQQHSITQLSVGDSWGFNNLNPTTPEAKAAKYFGEWLGNARLAEFGLA